MLKQQSHNKDSFVSLHSIFNIDPTYLTHHMKITDISHDDTNQTCKLCSNQTNRFYHNGILQVTNIKVIKTLPRLGY